MFALKLTNRFNFLNLILKFNFKQNYSSSILYSSHTHLSLHQPIQNTLKIIKNKLFSTTFLMKNILEDSFNILLSSTMKKRKTKMNRHKLKKRRKALRKNTKESRN